MLTLQEAKEQTDSILFKTKVPTPPVHWKDKLEALEEAGLQKHRESCIFDMRCWQANTIGFKQMLATEMCEMLMGSKHTEEREAKEKQVYEWVYFHHNHTRGTKADKWGSVPTILSRTERTGKWFLPPFSKQVIWEAQFGKLEYLKRDIPYGVVLKMNEIKTLNLFNVFNVLAPMEAWERKTDIDPIVTATIWELPLGDDGKPHKAGQVAHFFLAQW